MAAGRLNRSCAKCAVDPSLREAFGCESKEEYTLWRGTVYEVKTLGCPVRQLRGWERRCLDLYGLWRDRGVLPIMGGALDQSSVALEAFEFLDDLFDLLMVPKEPKSNGRRT